MAHILADRILESTTTTGTGVLTLAGAITGFRRFSAVCSVADTVPYFIEAIDSVGQPTGDYEYGTGTYSAANQLTRTTVLGSSNAGAAVNFAAGTKNVGLGENAASWACLKSANGYTKLPNGIILQWGTDATSGAGTVVVTFPIAFPNACLNATCSGASSAQVTAPTAFNATTVTLGAASLAGAPVVSNVRWHAIGY